MKKLLFLFLMFTGGVAHAIDFKVSREESGFVKHYFDGITASTSVILIDLSDVTNFPHVQTGAVNITDLRINVDKVAGSTMTIRAGVITSVSATVGSVEWFFSKLLELDTVGTHLVEEVNYAPGVIRAYVNSSGATPYILASSSTVSSSVYQTDVDLPTPNSPAGGTPPAVGDIIFRVDYETSGASSDLTVEAMYYTSR